ncbi:PA0069 family radical SAM protein [Methylocystis heyeri]|uniref:PA0069 family radical SAM protein n=1 Tax=Methylocystis heyeri TaxID=391905 RepID=A0A6B8KK05_9HYPH|nr:PA0069 family radical SAM protein [Methylocystis heyeri]QGM46923.1 PA0069 family radical SAM protein [Methylocystis heyeri]
MSALESSVNHAASRAPDGRSARRSRESSSSAPEIVAADVVAAERRRGRGAISKRSGRYEPSVREQIDDGWGSLETLDPLKTNIHIERPRSVITRNDSPDIAFDRSINPYRGCEHGCVYCFARPTHAYMGCSPGLDFETEIFVKEGAAQLLERELSAPGYAPKTIAIGTNTDPYQPTEKRFRVMRGVLETLQRADHPVGIVTKSALVTRDIDILAPMARKGLAKVAISITTLDGALARKMEPRAASPRLRLETIEKLSAAGIPTAVMVAPIIPGINDPEIETILTRAHAAGAREAGYVMLRLPLEVREIFTEWLVAHYPDKARHVLSLIRSTRDGKLYDAAFESRLKGEGPYAWMIGRRFEVAASRLGFGATRLRCDLFQRPRREGEQLSLF